MNKVYQLIYKKIQQKLNSYIKGGDIQEQTSLQRVQITLSNVKIRKSALNLLQIPLSVHNSSKIKKIQLSISHHPKLSVEVENLHIVINPSTIRNLNQQSVQERKFYKLNKWEENQRESLKNSNFGSKIVEWVVPNILSNVKVTLNNFTILYQDTETLQILGYPSLCVVKFSSVKMWRTNEQGDKGGDKNDKNIYVTVEINELSVLLRCDPLDFEKGTNIDSFYDEMKASDRNYLLRPCSFEAKIAVTKENFHNKIMYQVMLMVKDEINIAINEYQRIFIESFINFVDSSSILKQYASLKPKSSVKASPSEWWKYLISALKYDSRYNLSYILKTMALKEKYIDYYKRTQKVVQAPVLPKLNMKEQKEMKEIEETYLYEEIIVFRSQALDQIRKKITQDKHAYSKKYNEESIKEYIKEFYSDIAHELEMEDDSCDEKSEEITLESTNTINFTVEIPRIVLSLQVLSEVPEPEVELLSKIKCECGRCKKVESNSAKTVEKSEEKKLKKHDLPSRNVEFAKSNQFKFRAPPTHSLLPNRKMRDIAIEHGEEVLVIGKIGQKNHSNYYYETNILKEKTLIISVIDRIKILVTGTKDIPSCDIKIGNVHNFDPLCCIVKEFNYGYHDPVKSFSDLLNYKGWFNLVFKESEVNIPLWGLRHYFRDFNCLPEIEFLIHYYELEKGSDICFCGQNFKSESAMQKEFIATAEKSIHISNALKKTITRKWDKEAIKAIAMSIEKEVIRLFPYFLRACLRYFVSSILPKEKDGTKFESTIKLAKDKHTGSFKEKYVGVLELNISDIPFYLTTTCLSTLNYFLMPSTPLANWKSIHKSTFLQTLREVPEKVNEVKSIIFNWNRTKSVLIDVIKAKMMSIPKFTVEVNVAAIRLNLISLINYKSFVVPPQVVFCVNGVHVVKDIPLAIASLPRSSYLETILEYEIRPEYYFKLFAMVDQISVSTTSMLVSSSLSLYLNINPFKAHPLIPNLLVDLHVPTVKVEANKNLFPLFHILNCLEYEISLSKSSRDLSKFSNINFMDYENMNDYRSGIFKFDANKLRKDITKFSSDHSMQSERCRHCLFKYVKLQSFISISIGNMQEDEIQGICVDFSLNGRNLLEIVCKHAYCSIEEKTFSKRTNIFISEVRGSNSSGENFSLHAGREHIGMQPHIPCSIGHLFPLTCDSYLLSGEVPAYSLLTLKELINSNIINEDKWKPYNKHINAKRSASSILKYKSYDIEFKDSDTKGALHIDQIILRLIFNPSSVLVSALVELGAMLSESKNLSPKPPKTYFQLKNLSNIFLLSVSYLNINIEIEDFEIEAAVKDIEFNVFPIASAPPLSQIVLNKNKESENSLMISNTLSINQVNVEIGRILKIKIQNILVELHESKHCKIKIVNKHINAYSHEEESKVNLKITSILLSNDEVLIAAIPGEHYRHELLISKSKHLIEAYIEQNEVFLTLPNIGVIVEIAVFMGVISRLASVDLVVEKKPENFADEFVVDPLTFKREEKQSRFVVHVTSLALKLFYEASAILQFKVQNLYVHHNMTKGHLEQYLSLDFKKSLDPNDNIFSDADEFVAVLRKLELIPEDSIHMHMVEMPEFSVSVRINVKSKKISVTARRPLNVVVVNKVFEELILSIKELKKSAKKQKKEKESKNEFTLEVVLNGGKIHIPLNSRSSDMVVADVEFCRLSYKLEDHELYRPTAIEENAQVYKSNQVLHDEYESLGKICCDSVSITLKNAKIETQLERRIKKIGSVGEIYVSVVSPEKSEELQKNIWKTDNFVNVTFKEASIKTSVSNLVVVQKIFESNFDEELTGFPKVLKWQKLDLVVSAEEAETAVEQFDLEPGNGPIVSLKKVESENQAVEEFLSLKRNNTIIADTSRSYLNFPGNRSFQERDFTDFNL